MKIFHLANDYAGSTVYKNLIYNLDQLGISQIVYTAIRSDELINKNNLSFVNKDSYIVYSNLLSFYDRVNFFYKIKKITIDITNKVDVDEINLIHAHTWYSDGAVAYELFKKYKIPYVITIRNTDLNLFYKYMFHLRNYGKEILINATKIIFISDVYKQRFLKTNLFLKNKLNFENKINVLYNGIDEYWIGNVMSKKKFNLQNHFSILYIGKFDKGKNVIRLINALNIINSKKTNVITLTLVGGGGNDNDKVIKLINKYENINYEGSVYEKQKLKELFGSHHLFAMPSSAETFGLVYIEAISQGLPIINTINEGIYGMYPNIGESVEYKSTKQIATAILKIKNNYNDYNFEPSEIIKNHDWKNIALKYKVMYENILTNA